MAGLPYLPKSILETTNDQEWSNMLTSSMASLGQAGADIMKPLGEQLRMGVQRLAPSPAPQPTPAPQPAPEPAAAITPFSLGSLEDWGFGAKAQPAQPQQQQGVGFNLPSVGDFLGTTLRTSSRPGTGPQSPGAGQQPRPVAPGAPTPGAAAPGPPGPIDNSSRQAFVRTAYPYALRAADGDAQLARQLLATAISENGKVGTGRDLGEMGFNVGGIQGVKGTAGSFTALDAGRPREFAAYHDLAEGFRAVRDLVSGGRYAQAAATYTQTGDIDRYWGDVNRAGYSETPDWQDRIADIRRSQVDPIVSGIAAPGVAPTRLSPASSPPDGVPTAVADGAGWRQTWGKDLTPHQINETLKLGLSWDAALATCGVAAAVAFARANGRTPTFGEALDLAKKTGEWTQDVGMTRGTTGQIALLKGLGVDAEARPLNEAEIASTVTAGQPVQINAHGNGGHFYVAQGYDPTTRKFDFGNSAAILKRSGGNTWYRLDELSGLGVGSPSEAIYLKRTGAAR